MARAQRQFNVDPQSGFAPTVWNSWQTTWTGTETDVTTRTRNAEVERVTTQWEGRRLVRRTRNVVREETLSQQINRVDSARSGVRTLVVEDVNNTTQGTRLISRELAPAVRSRNITVDGKRFKPKKRLYAFFDGQDVNRYVFPKLLEISMSSGVFQVGENVIGESLRSGSSGTWPSTTTPSISFRVASSNHREGIFSSPTEVYETSPYDDGSISSSYNGASTICLLYTSPSPRD